MSKVRRAHLLAALWNKDNTTSLSVLKPKDYGWILEHGSYKISWYNCDKLPKNLIDIQHTNDGVVNEEDELTSTAYDSDDSNDGDNEHY